MTLNETSSFALK